MAKDTELERLGAARDQAFQRKQAAWKEQDQAWNNRSAIKTRLDQAYQEKGQAYAAQEAS